MDAQNIGLAAAVASSTIAGLGLLLNWHREQEETRPRLVTAAAMVIGIVGVVGTASVVVSSTGPEENVGERSLRPSAQSLTKAEYRQRAGAACSEAYDAADRLRRLEPKQPVGNLSVTFEESAVQQLAQLTPPPALQEAHREGVAIWKRRIVLLKTAFRRPTPRATDELRAQLTETDRLADHLDKLFRKLRVPECII